MLRNEIETKFPYISVVEYGGKEYVGVINNQDNSVTSVYVYTDLLTEIEKKDFLETCEAWWWESNRMIPIGIFMRKEMQRCKHVVMIMATKDVRVLIGPCTNLNKLAIKRTKRKSVQLVRQPK
jgi:hypothetical protein